MKFAVALVLAALAAVALADQADLNHIWNSFNTPGTPNAADCLCASPFTYGCSQGSNPIWPPTYNGVANGSATYDDLAFQRANFTASACYGGSCSLSTGSNGISAAINATSLFRAYAWSMTNTPLNASAESVRSCSMVWVDVPIFDPRIFTLCGMSPAGSSGLTAYTTCIQVWKASAGTATISAVILAIAAIAGLVFM